MILILRFSVDDLYDIRSNSSIESTLFSSFHSSIKAKQSIWRFLWSSEEDFSLLVEFGKPRDLAFLLMYYLKYIYKAHR